MSNSGLGRLRVGDARASPERGPAYALTLGSGCEDDVEMFRTREALESLEEPQDRVNSKDLTLAGIFFIFSCTGGILRVRVQTRGTWWQKHHSWRATNLSPLGRETQGFQARQLSPQCSRSAARGDRASSPSLLLDAMYICVMCVRATQVTKTGSAGRRPLRV